MKIKIINPINGLHLDKIYLAKANEDHYFIFGEYSEKGSYSYTTKKTFKIPIPKKDAMVIE